MTDYYPSSPLPAPAPGTLPYPWVTQFDPTHQATFYVNLETQESTWTLPDLSNLPSFNPPPAPAVDGARSASDNGTYYGGGVADDSYSHSTAPYPSSNTGQAAVGGEASSFYASSGTTPQDPGQSTYTNQTQPPQSFDANGQPIQGSGDGERGLGKMIVGGGAIYLAYKLYKDYQKGKLKQDYFVPPNQVHAPHGSYQYHHNASDHLRPSQSINPAAQMSNSTSKFPTTSDLYPGPPLDPYNSGATNSQVSYGNYNTSLTPQQPAPAGFDYQLSPFNNGGGAVQPPQYDPASSTFVGNGYPNYITSLTNSPWRDPRF